MTAQFRAVSFSGGGHMLVYQLGVLASLRERGMTASINCYAGSSGGAIVAAAAACIPDSDFNQFTEFAVACDSRRGLEELLPVDAHQVFAYPSPDPDPDPDTTTATHLRQPRGDSESA